jgi:hypothetical protein
MALRGRRIDDCFEIWCLVASESLEIFKLHQPDYEVVWWTSVFEAVEASEVNEAAEVLQSEKSLLRTSVVQVLEFSFILTFKFIFLLQS